MSDAQTCLGEPSPFMLLEMASGVIELTTPRPLDSFPGQERDRIDGSALVESFIGSGHAALDALALAVCALHPDRRLADGWRRGIDPAALAHGPGWLHTMDQVTVTGTVLQTHPLGDGDNLLISWQWPDGAPATVVVYIDHNMGTIVKDAFAVPEDGATLVATYTSLDDGHMTFAPVDPADTRARVIEAIETGERVVPPLETDTWPLSRPLVEWIVRQLPEGGTGQVRPDWSEEEREQLLVDFLSSPQGAVAGLTGLQVRQLAEPLLWFGCDYGPGDPLRWSPVAVEIVLADWYPRKIFGVDAGLLVHLPAVLGAFIRFAHERRQVPADLTAETVGAVEQWRGDYLAAVGRSDRSPRSGAARLARLAAGVDPDDELDVDDAFGGDLDDDDLDAMFDDADLGEIITELEAEVVAVAGGRAAYETLDDDPLPEADFDWSAVGDDQREATASTLEHLDRWSSELFDDEVRTIARVVLAAVVRTDPSVFRRSSRTDSLAAAVLAHLLNRLSGRLGPRERTELLGWKVSSAAALARAVGVSASSVTSRARTVADVVDRADIHWPDLLHSSQRAEILQAKAVIDTWRADNP